MTRLRACGGAIAALALSGALHAAGLLIVAAPPQRIEVAGGGTPDIAAIGAAFADFVAGGHLSVPPHSPPSHPRPHSAALRCPHLRWPIWRCPILQCR
jgi:protein TonB